jgi:hypothetical protein
MTPRAKGAKQLKRKIATRRERKTIVAFCEGEASEPDYINGLKRLPEIRRNTSINIEIDSVRGVPLTLVKRAIERGKDSEVDECWCVFDVEWPRNHPNLNQAIQLAEKYGIHLAISNPSFELWLILHFEDQFSHLNTSEAERKSRKFDNRTNKRINPDQYMRLRQTAARRAEKLVEHHARNDTLFPDNNPSSTMNELLRAIEG